jgi:uncharacterized protein (DUF2249 family)
MTAMKKSKEARAKQPGPGLKPLVLDTRPIFERGGTPCGPVDDAVAALKPGQNFVLLASFEPAPLYAKLAQDGFSHKSTQLPDGTWRIEFQKSGS